MEIKRRHWSLDDAQSSNKIEIESDTKRRMKRKINEYDEANYLIDEYRKKVAKDCKKMMDSSVFSESNPFDFTNTNEKFVCGKKIECDSVEGGFSCARPTNTKNSHLPLRIMYSGEEERRKQREIREDIEQVTQNRLLGRIDGLSMCLGEPYLIFEELEVKDMEDLREDIKVYLYLDRTKPTRIRFWEALLVVCDWELAEARKKEALDRARVCGEQPPAEFLGEEWELDSRAEADIKNLLQGKSHNQLEVLRSEIESQMSSGSDNVVEYWELILRHVQIYKAKAFLKEECRVKILRLNVEKDHRSIRRQEVDAAGYDGKNDQTGTEGADSSSSPELFYGEGTGDNFEMKATGVMEEGNALSRNNDEVNLQSPVYWPINKCRAKRTQVLQSRSQ